MKFTPLAAITASAIIPIVFTSTPTEADVSHVENKMLLERPALDSTQSPPLLGRSSDEKILNKNNEIAPFSSNINGMDPQSGSDPINQFQEPLGDLNLNQALSLALKQNPELLSYFDEISARNGAVAQAELLPNPSLGISASNLGNSILKDFDGPVTTIRLSQFVQLGGKRAKAISVAQLDRDLAVWDLESKRMDLLTDVVHIFVELLAVQEKQLIADNLIRVSKLATESIEARVKAGKVSPVEQTRAQVNLALVKIEQQRVARKLSTTRKRLAATWGSTEPGFDFAVGELDTVNPIPSFESLLVRLRQNPDLARWASEISYRQSSIELAESQAIPDLTLSLGLQHFVDLNDNALVAGISLPLPVFNRNQGAIAKANHRLNKAVHTRRNIEVTVTTALNTAYQRLASALTEVSGYKTSVLPGAEDAFKAVQKGYRLGKFDLLDVLDTQRTLFNAKDQYLSAITAYHKAVADVERLIGTSIFEDPK